MTDNIDKTFADSAMSATDVNSFHRAADNLGITIMSYGKSLTP